MASSSNDPDNERLSDTHTRVNQRAIVLFPHRQNKFPWKKSVCRRFYTVKRERTLFGKSGKENMPLQKNHDAILFDHNHDGIDRRGFLKCMAWPAWEPSACSKVEC